MPFPLSWIREQFPALKESDTVYLDNAAGAQVPQQVIANMTQALSTMQVNKGGAYSQSKRITQAKEQVREKTATFLNAANPDAVTFGPNATTLIELLAQAVGRWLKAGDEIIVTGLDHHANIDPWRRLSERGVVLKTWLPTGDDTQLALDDLAALLSDKTRLVAMTLASNALGTLTPVHDAVKRIHQAGCYAMVDAVHYAPHYLPDVQALAVDALVFSPYKVFGPHLGVLYLAEPLRQQLSGPRLSFFPTIGAITWEPGTQNHEAIYAFGGVFEYLNALAAHQGLSGSERQNWQTLYHAFAAHERALFTQLWQGLADLPCTCYGVQGTAGRTATLSFNLDHYSPATVANHLAADGIAVASGHYYAYDLMMKHLGLEPRGGAVRLSLLHYNTEADVARVLTSLSNLVQ
jgi:cysteine desulfurase family protein (TIGR01976 family)